MNLTSKNRITLLASILISLVIGLLIGSYIPKIQSSYREKAEAELTAKKQADIETRLQQERILDKKDFSMKIPTGWAEIQAMPSTTATVAYVKEAVTNETLKKINFRSYYAITFDALNKKTILGYSSFLKSTLQKLLPGIKFTQETTEKIADRDARIIEAEINQRGADFKILIAIIKGDDDKVWTISFNTGKDTWDSYRDTFLDVTRSFQVKTANE